MHDNQEDKVQQHQTTCTGQDKTVNVSVALLDGWVRGWDSVWEEYVRLT